MAYDAQAYDLDAETDDVIRGFGMAPTPINLVSMAAEMELRLRIYPGGMVQAGRIVRELQQRALGAAAAAKPETPAPRPRPGG